MNPGTVCFVSVALIVLQLRSSESVGVLEMVSNYARVAKNEERTTTEPAGNFSASIAPMENVTTEPIPEYEDFDDLEEDRALKETSSKQTMMKYFNAIVSLLAFLYKFNGSFKNVKPQTLHFNNQNEPRIATGKHLKEAQDRFEFPQKKFKYNGENSVDQYQPIENYPPYDPLKANSAETYNKDGKSSYDVDITQYDLTKNSVDDVEVQQSYSYEIPYDDGNEQSWNNHDVHPVYHPWMSKQPEDKPAPMDSYQPWKQKPKPSDSEPRQPWNVKPANDFPVHHHDFKDPPPPPPPSDHHFEYHEMDHSVDEDRVSKKPYSYYFLGRKLWYVPLLFSVYFIIYVGALVLKSVARHKIQFPEKIWNLHDDHFGHGKHRRHRKVDDITDNYEKAVEKMSNKFM